MPKMYKDGEFESPCYVEDVLLRMQDLPCDKGNTVYLRRKQGETVELTRFDIDCLKVDEGGDLIIDLDVFLFANLGEWEDE